MHFTGLVLQPVPHNPDSDDFDTEYENYDWEIRFLGKRFLHERYQSRPMGWSWGTHAGIRLRVKPSSKLAALFKKALVVREFGDIFAAVTEPGTKLVRRKSGAVELHFEKYVWRRSPTVDHSSGRSWSAVVTANGRRDFNRVPSDYWGLLDEKVQQLEKSKQERVSNEPVDRTQIESPAPQTDRQDSGQTDQRRKRTKYGIRIHSSDRKYSFDFGCWRSTKYPGMASIRIGIAGKRKLYTISQRDLEALLEELRRGRPAPPENPPRPK